MAFTESQAYLRRVYLPQAKESAYNDGDTHASVNFMADPIGTDQFRPSFRTLNDRMKATGREGITKQIPTEQDVPTQALPLWASIHSLAWGLAFGLGFDDMDPSGVNRTHAFTMCANNEFPGSFGLLDYVNGPVYDAQTDLSLAGCFVDSQTFEWGTEDFVAHTLNIGGSGKRIGTSNVTESGLTNFGALGHLLANKTRVWIGSASGEGDSAWGGGWTPHSSPGVFANGASLTNVSEYASNFTLTINNGFMRRRSGGMSSGSGVFGVQPRLGRNRLATLSCDLLGLSTSTFMTDVLGQTYANNAEYTIIVEFVTDVLITGSVYYGGMIVLPLAGVEEVPASGGAMDGLRSESLTFFSKDETTDSLAQVYGFVENGITTVFNQAAA